MCLGIPGRIVEITGAMAKIDVAGTRKEASLMLMENVSVGDYVIVHAGFAIQKVNEKEASETLKIVKDIIGDMPS
ncbi:MAG: HypC/HybG/HupF family hydrogenase formation chaperone [Candidatus Jettenia sp.]|uniref:Hydrogenase assembly chaperone n=1 Tax=Candidatus Jettenia caeni TaxID=247490 RepID=I3IGJ1_9BACT|nr:HypC/HybG/HupF family hydrogenase formation chaperone [Candidatus Jettenia sp. AMX1]MBC6929795.1 HypC/HybG/HupF family hydrogenase formation chaperone [Candidatus Jettenia sp.]NUN22539.1 HypC/HybG/HupF family hydrogenase formation chaperone [Candidatus Jettenia caeni]KAA0248769.1 MAG: HypC/HybG/HupF family hydrogenase formation chaperone [Candidatus Jettenia sp. AMX1]MCE7881390.1 HypC/HybG/HupF family hydrogenase formation chaperone [Candidatus Jettenia sp. AMX1]MCQ3927971.1 HypC/HybG/HupF 